MEILGTLRTLLPRMVPERARLPMLVTWEAIENRLMMGHYLA